MIRQPRALLRLAPLFLLVAGCTATVAPASDAGATDAAPAPSAAAPADAGATPDAAPTQPAAPTIKELMKMAGALHVVWTNGQKDCDSVEGERKSGTDDFKVIFTVPGTADNKMDNAATAKTPYTYRLRCKRGEVYSAYSNEMSGTP